MVKVTTLDELHAQGRIRWNAHEHAWIAEPDEVVAALAQAGFEERRREIARSRSDREPAGGLWQGVNRRTGSVASAVWVNVPAPVVFVDIDGVPVRA